MAVGEIAAELPVSRPAVSQHLRVLREARLVESREHGTRRIYAVRREGLAELRAQLDRFWETALQGFASAAALEGKQMQDRIRQSAGKGRP